MKNNLLILQARLGSKRLPSKVLREVKGKPLILHQIERIRSSRLLNNLVVAIPTGAQDDLLANCLEDAGVSFHRGDEHDVFSRFEEVIAHHSAEVLIRSTADCPLFMSELLDDMLEIFEQADADYLSNCLPPTFPDGLDIEIFRRDSFHRLGKEKLTPKQREHVTLGFYDHNSTFKTMNFKNSFDLSHERWTVDYIEDFQFIEQILNSISPSATFSEVLSFLRRNPQVKNLKSGSFRNISLMEGKNHD